MHRDSLHEPAVIQLSTSGDLHTFMPFFRFTTDKIIKRLRWLMVFTILFDKFNTLVGQPSRYWHHPEAVREGNHLVHYFMSRGLPAYIIFSLVYMSLAFFIVSIIPRRLAIIGLVATILSHFFGACTWMCYYWHFGPCIVAIYGIILGVVFVQMAIPTPDKMSTHNLSSNDPAANTALKPTATPP